MRIFLQVFLILTISFNSIAQTGTVTVFVEADTYIEGGTSSARNFSAETLLKQKRISDASTTYNRIPFLKFDIQNINKNNIAEVSLQIFCNRLDGSGFGVDVFNVSSNWIENTLTWDNAPVLSNKVISANVPKVLNEWFKVDVLNAFLAANTSFSLALKNSIQDNINFVEWKSKESNSNVPQLIIKYKANKPTTFTANVKLDNSVELAWDTLNCNASSYLIERKYTESSTYEPVANVQKGDQAFFIDKTVNLAHTVYYRLTAINNGGINAEPFQVTVLGTKSMEYMSATSTHPINEPILAGTKNNPLLRIKIVTSGPQAPYIAESFIVNTKGTSNIADVEGIQMFYTGSDSMFVNPVIFSEKIDISNTDDLVLQGNQQLNDGMNYFWLTCDVNKNAENKNIVDAQCVELKIRKTELETKIPETTAPLGSREIVRFLTPAFKFEHLTRGLVAVNANSSVFLSWRIFATDDNVSFNIYRNGIKVNNTPLTSVSNFTDTQGNVSDIYHIEVVSANGSEFSSPVNVWQNNYKDIKLKTPAGYTPGDVSVADLDGDGELEFVVKFEKSTKDNSQSGYTDPVFLHAYKLDGKFLWSINLGINIRAGAHYTQFMVYDLDGDGKAEVVCKTAPGTRDASNSFISNGPAANTNHATDYRNSNGYILTGPEYLTVFDGETGFEVSTVNYIPQRATPYALSTWGDTYGNRVDRFLAGVAYFDSIPSVVMCRGYYSRTALTAYDFKNKKLEVRWAFDTQSNPSLYADYTNQGNHNLAIADVDADGKHEIVYGGMTIDDDGKPLYSTLYRHGDALHLGDLIPEIPGLEFFRPSENAGKTTRTGEVIPGVAVHKAATGEVIWSKPFNGDIGRAISMDITAEHPGNEFWASSGLGVYNSKGHVISSSVPAANFAAWWDGDLLREILNSTTVSKWNVGNIFTATGCVSNNGTKSNPAISGDILGDWREEVVFRTSDNQNLRIFTTTTPSAHGIYTLLQDPTYRMSLVWQNVSYNQPPHTGYFLGANMSTPPMPNIDVMKASGSAINIVSPINGKEYDADSPIVFAVNALGISDIASEVVLYDQNNQEIARIDQAPYLLLSSTLTLGEHTIKAVAKDINNNTITSLPVTFKINVASGIRNQEAVNANIFVYPIPAKDKLMVDLGNASEIIESISVVDIVGKPIKTISNISSSKTDIDISGLVSGIYYIRIQSSLNYYIKTFVVKN